MRSKSSFLLALPVLFGATACGAPQIPVGGDYQVSGRELVRISADWIKNKNDSFDVQLNLENESNRYLVIFFNTMGCMRGPVPGQLAHTFFGAGERKIDLVPRERKAFTLVCKLDGVEQRGDYVITIGTVCDNPTGDGATAGDVLARDLEWRVPASAVVEE
jgi:hypothetical protein